MANCLQIVFPVWLLLCLLVPLRYSLQIMESNKTYNHGLLSNGAVRVYSNNLAHALVWNSEMLVCKQSSFAESHKARVGDKYGKLEHAEAKRGMLLNERKGE